MSRTPRSIRQRYIPIADFAAYTGLSPHTIWRHARAGKIAACKVGGRVLGSPHETDDKAR